MLAIQPTSSQKTRPNLLPCRINHDGPVNSASRFWTPETDDKGTSHVHFRGRHLHGTSVPLPSNYVGSIINVTEKTLPHTSTATSTSHLAHNDDDDEEEAEHDADMDLEDAEEVKIAEQMATFDDVVIWEHGGKVDVESSAFVRGLDEWIGFAEGMHCDDDEEVGEVINKDQKS